MTDNCEAQIPFLHGMFGHKHGFAMAHGSIRRLDRDWGLPGRPEQRPSNRRATQRGSRRRVFDRSNQTLGAFLDEWLLLQRDRLRPSTLYSYDVIVERIKAGLGQVKIQAITPRQIEHFYATLIESGGRQGKGFQARPFATPMSCFAKR